MNSDNEDEGDNATPDTSALTPAANSGSEKAQKSDVSAPGEQAASLGGTPKAGTRKDSSRPPGALRGNSNALRTHSRGSKMPVGCRHEELLVAETIKRVKAEWTAKHGDGVWPVWADVQLQMIRRATERDRVAAKLLRTLKDLKGADLTHAEQVAQRKIQEAALQTIESCLTALGLGTPTPEALDPWFVEAASAKELPAEWKPAPQQDDEPQDDPDTDDPAAYDRQF